MLHKCSIFLQYIFGQPKSLNRILAITALVYVYFIGGFINNSITNSVSTLTVALVENQTIVINPYLFDRRDVAKYNDNYYSGVPPGASFLLTPVYSLVKTTLFFLPQGLEKKIDSFIYKSLNIKYPEITESNKRFGVLLLLIFAVFFVSIPLALIVGYSFYKITIAWFDIKDHDFILILCAFLLLGTLFADFSSTFYHNTVAACFAWFVFIKMITHFHKEYSIKTLLLHGVLAGILPTLDYPALAYTVVLYFSFILSFKKSLRLKYAFYFTLGTTIPFLLLLLYHYVAFGSPWTTSYHLRAIEPLHYLFTTGNESILWGFLPTWGKIFRVFTDTKISLLIYNPFLPLGVILCAIYFFRGPENIHSNSKWQHLWGTLFFLLLANLGYFMSIPLTINPAGGSYGARYTVYSVPGALFACTPLLYWIYKKLSKSFFILLLCLLSLPAWIYLFYGSPNRPLKEYVNLFLKIGPSNYSIIKAFEAGIIQTPIYSYLGISILLVFCYLLWKLKTINTRL